MQTWKIRALPKKNNNVKGNRGNNNCDSVTIRKNGKTGNLDLKSGFLTFKAKISFV